ncbi:SipW-dependent-type signal peptide-containing protein [Halodesulfurarchaeum formicicum]|uniref:SipW-cognate class signal peptide n=1 Tax=Halodesulfurarchaeum formicicum TaxID=1873524 RepID=A0A1J1AB59_9EURY|nr:SipW-dependent-type signal peptide-containing protein [Halodesulfurarchaeum formicicum]APE95372.1 hypothetical protein HSR6_0919 [Halodesulfurarchaeum formicicum]
MSKDDNNTFEISRRKTLAALGTIGAASAGAGLGTSAWFNDTETFDNNIVTAGTLDLIVNYYSWWDQGMAGSGSVSGTADGEAVTAELSDVKPGDNGRIVLSPRIETNPAYLWLCGELTANDENGLTEPEALVDDTGGDPGEWQGELAQSIDVTVGYCDIQMDGGDLGPNDVSTEQEIWTGSLADFLMAIEAGVPLDGGSGVPEEGSFFEPGDQSCFAGTEDEGDTPSLCLEWEVPGEEVGNEIQGDSLEFDLQMYAEQCRHNDGTTNPCAPARTVSTGDGFSDISFEKALNMQALARGGSGRGEIQVHGDSGGVEDTNVYGSDTYPSNTDIPFTAEIDPTAQTASLTVNEVTVTDDDVTDGDANGDSTGDPEWPSGVPDYIDVSINASSASGNDVTTVVEDVVINGSPVSTSISENDGKEYLAVTNVDASSTATVEGTIRFEGSQSDYTTEDWVGIDFR